MDGFDACRFVGAYDEATTIVNNQKSEASRIDEMSTQRDQLPKPTATDPAAPQQAEVERVVNEMVGALKTIRAGAEIDTALVAIGKNLPVTESARRKGQQWLFIQFCAAKFSSALLATLEDLAGGSNAPMLAAQKILAVLPKPDAPTNLGNLNQMSAQEKETAGLTSKLREKDKDGNMLYQKMDWDWTWWSNRLQQESLYTSNDGGLGGLASQLQKAYAAWEGKKAQGEAMKDQDAAKAEMAGKQEKTTTEDKLSMAFPLEDLARAYERMKVLLAHLTDHCEFYNYALFQALPPSEQALRIVEASKGKLQVGLFEPRVVAMNGSRLVVPLTPLAGSPTLQSFVTNLGNDLDVAFGAALTTPDSTILPTPGVSISSRLGKCSGCEEYIEAARTHELARLEALAQQEQREAERRQKRIDDKNYDDFRDPPPAVKLEIESNQIGLEIPPEV